MSFNSLRKTFAKLPWRKVFAVAYVLYNVVAPLSAVPAVFAVGYDECVGSGAGCHATLQDAIDATSDGDVVGLTSDITVTSRPNINKDITLEGDGYTIYASFEKTDNSNNAALGVFGDGVTIQNIVLDGTGSKPYPKHLHGINTYEASNVNISNVVVKNFSASGIVVNSSEVTVSNVTTFGNGWNGINVDQRTSLPSVLNIPSTINVPTIYVDDATLVVTVNDVLGQYTATHIGHDGNVNDLLYTPADNTPPVVPTGLHILDHNGVDLGCGGYTNDRSITVDWDDNTTDLDFAYFLYDVKDNDGIAQLTESEFSGDIRDIDGDYKYKIRAVDTSGNISAASEWCSVTLDRVAPDQVELTSPYDGAFVNGNPLQTWNDLPNTDFYTYESSLDDTFSTIAYTTDVSTNHRTVGGNQTVTIWWRVKATDMAGNEGPWSEAWQVNVDNTGPVAPTILTPDTDEAFNSSPILNDWTDVTDPSGISKYRIQYEYDDGHTFSGYPYRETTISQRNHTPATSEEGGVKYRVQAFDGVGNEGDWSDWRHYYYDLTAPVTVFTDPVDDDVFSAGFDITGTTEDEVGVSEVILSYKLSSDSTWTQMITGTDLQNFSGTPVFNWSHNWTPSEDGQYDLMAKAYDTAGNLESTAYVYGIYFDTSNPAISIDSPAVDTYHNDNVEFMGTATDSVSDVDYVKVKLTNEGTGEVCKLDGKAWRNATYDDVTDTWSYTLPKGECEDGYYLVGAKAWDLAGNNKYKATHIYLDTTAPEVPTWGTIYNRDTGEEIGCGGYTNTTHVDFEWNANSESDLAGYWFGIVNKPHHQWFDAPNTYKTANMTPGRPEYYYTVTAVDLAGNESELSTQCGLTLDQEKPTIDPVEVNETYYEGDLFPDVDVTAHDNEMVTGICFDVVFAPDTEDEFTFFPMGGDITDNCWTTEESTLNGWGSGTDTEYTWSLNNAIETEFLEDFTYFDTALLNEGNYRFNYYVMDIADNMSDMSQTDVTLENVPPSLLFGSDQTIVEGTAASFTGEFSDPSYIEDYGPEMELRDYTPENYGGLKPDDSIWTVYIDYGDGSEPLEMEFPIPGEIDFLDHVYTSNGVYTATADVCESEFTTQDEYDEFFTPTAVDDEDLMAWQNGEGKCDVQTVTVTVTDLTPTVSITSNQPTTVVTGTAVTLTANPVGGNAPYTYAWTGACSGTNQTATVNTTVDDTYNCTVEVTDVDGDTTTSTYSFNSFTPVAPAQFQPAGEVQGAQDEATDGTQDSTEDGEVKGEVCTETMISGYVYVDENGDNEMNNDEMAFESVTVMLLDENGEEVDSVETDENGYYEFSACEGKYTVKVDSDTLDSKYEVLGASMDVDSTNGAVNADFVVEKATSLMDYWWVLLLILLALGGTAWYVSRRKVD